MQSHVSLTLNHPFSLQFRSSTLWIHPFLLGLWSSISPFNTPFLYLSNTDACKFTLLSLSSSLPLHSSSPSVSIRYSLPLYCVSALPPHLNLTCISLSRCLQIYVFLTESSFLSNHPLLQAPSDTCSLLGLCSPPDPSDDSFVSNRAVCICYLAPQSQSPVNQAALKQGRVCAWQVE